MRKIIHVDMDAFFASIEQRDNPDLKGKPIVVGGSPNSRGVVAAASYESRKFGIRSAMASAQAKRLCPQLIFVRPDFEKYVQDSERIMAILRQHTDLVEPVSLDEAYLDVTRHRFGIQDPVLVASIIKQNIFAATKLTASAGVAPNLFLAKIASDFQKPNGLTVVRQSEVMDFLKDLPVRKVPGVGPVTEETLSKLGIRVCGDILKHKPADLVKALGKWGTELYRRALGEDDREVIPYSDPKQYGSEETFEKDSRDVPFLIRKLEELSQSVFEGARRSGYAGKTIVLKVKYHDFERITRSQTLSKEPVSWQEVHKTVSDLLVYKTEAGRKAIRLLGVSIAGLRSLGADKKTIEPDLFLG